MSVLSVLGGAANVAGKAFQGYAVDEGNRVKQSLAQAKAEEDAKRNAVLNALTQRQIARPQLGDTNFAQLSGEVKGAETAATIPAEVAKATALAPIATATHETNRKTDVANPLPVTETFTPVTLGGGEGQPAVVKPMSTRTGKTLAPIGDARPGTTPIGGKPTEGETKAAGMHHRVIPAGQLLNTFDTRKTLDEIAASAGLMGNWASTDKGRQLRTTGLRWVTSVLRPESGATITPAEEKSYFAQYLPQPGDDEGTLANKRQARREAEEAVAIQAGKALPKGTPTSAIQADSLSHVRHRERADSAANPSEWLKNFRAGRTP